MRAFLQAMRRRYADWRERRGIVSGRLYFNVVQRKKALYVARLKEIDDARQAKVIPFEDPRRI